MCALASGSKGNCIYIECGKTRILVDAGLSKREIRGRLARIGVTPEQISGIVVSHEHADHIKGVGVMARGFGIPVYMTGRTLSSTYGRLGNGIEVREFGPGEPFQVGDIYVEPFSTPHDAADPAGFAFHHGGVKLGFATDLGYATRLVIERLKGSDMLFIESNHDPVMLKEGPYPWMLKQRVAGKEGHLSNDDAGRLLGELLHPGLMHVVLAHLSETNNLPELAYNTTRDVLTGKSSEHVRLSVAMQDRVGEIIGV
ncbi:MAG TPA: MBL fold metallo-hydrolase [Nitrospirota bacterium]